MKWLPRATIDFGPVTGTVRDEQSGKGERYGYDAMNQLASASYNADQVWTGNPQNATRTVSYSLDALNRQSVNDNGTVTPYAPNALNQYGTANGTIYNSSLSYLRWAGALCPANGQSAWRAGATP